MKLLNTVLAGLIVLPLSLAHADAPDEATSNNVTVNGFSSNDALMNELTTQARNKVSRFARSLKKTLSHELKTHGSVSAVSVCNTDAPAIADQNSSDGWLVSRTSLKVRNAANQAEPWEKAVLMNFEKQLALGADPVTLEHTEVVDGTFRYMKAIPTGSVCLVCHGSSVAPELTNHIKQLYPDDQATGFSVGDLRGAFSLSKKL